MKKILYVSFLSIFSIFYGCKEEPVVILSTSSDVLSLSAVSASKPITITSNQKWTVTSNASWCSVSDSTGTGNKDIVVLCQNNLTVNPRQTSITIQSGKQTKAVVVTQSGGQSLMDNDFLDYTTNWISFVTDTISANVINGFYNIKNTCRSTSWYLTKVIIPNFTGNYMITTKYQVVSGTLPFGLVFGYKDSQNFYRLLIYPSKSCIVAKFSKGVFSSITINSIVYTPQNTIKLLKIGNNCDVYLNDLKLNSFDFSNPFGGGVGFYSCPQTEVNVDNIKVIQF